MSLHVLRIPLLAFFLLGATAAHAVEPDVSISSPSDGSTFAIGDNVNFAAAATDAEDDDATLTAAISWTSSLDGNIGTGGSFGTTSLTAGTHTVTASVMDSEMLSASDSITVTVTNDAPTADAQSVSTDEDTALPITLTGSDPEGSNLSFQVESQPTNGAVSGTAPNVTYTPNADYNGSDSFTFTVNDGQLTSGAATVSITVNPVNDAPVANDDTASVAEDSSNNQIDVLANDTDPDGDSLTVQSASASTGTATPNGPGTAVVYTPPANFTGQATINYTISDGNGGTDSATVTVTVTNENDAPVANDDTASVAEDSSNNQIDVLANDTDPDGDSLTVQSASASTGTATPNGPGTAVVYTPPANFTGQATINYTISDGNGGTDSATVTVTVTNENDAPVANDDTASVAEDSSNNQIDVLANDTDPDGDSLTVQSASASTGTATPNGPGTAVVYTPPANFTGQATINYTISDGNGGTDSATVTVTVTNENDAPVANDDTASVAEDSSNNQIDVLANDTDPDGDSLTVQSASASTGTATPNGPGTAVVYTPPANFTGQATINYTISDGNGGTDSATVTVTVTNENDAPVANDDTASVAEDSSNNQIDVLANDTDPDGDSLTVQSASASTGTATPNGPGTAVVYTPPANFTGQATINYTISDGNGGTDSATGVCHGDRRARCAAGRKQRHGDG